MHFAANQTIINNDPEELDELTNLEDVDDVEDEDDGNGADLVDEVEPLENSNLLSGVEDEEDAADMADPESDDDTLLNAQQVGLHIDDDYDEPRPLNIAHDIERAERAHRQT